MLFILLGPLIKKSFGGESEEGLESKIPDREILKRTVSWDDCNKLYQGLLRIDYDDPIRSRLGDYREAPH